MIEYATMHKHIGLVESGQESGLVSLLNGRVDSGCLLERCLLFISRTVKGDRCRTLGAENKFIEAWHLTSQT